MDSESFKPLINHEIKKLKYSAFVNIGWTGWIGAIQGYSSSKLAISEIGVYFSG
jgi:hypothetical protein